jgi:hypothetical protein
MPSTRLLVLLICGAALVTAPSALASHGRLVKLSHFTKQGRHMLAADGISGPVTLRGSVGQTTFYTATQPDGNTCFLIGKTSDTIATTMCQTDPDQFGPSRPVLDAAFFHSPAGHLEESQLIGFYGFTTSGVAAVDLVAPDGSFIPVPFQNGLFAQPTPEGDATGLVALDASGKVIYQQTFPY